MINRFTNKALAVFGVLCLALGLTLLMALAPAQPAQAVGVCTADAICFYDTSGSWYPMVDHDDADTSPGECFGMGANVYRTSYIWNRTDHQYYVYKGANCSGTRGTIYANSSGAMDSNWNDAIVSYKRIG
jgi:(2Fe-2S) ferredoxin